MTTTPSFLWASTALTVLSAGRILFVSSQALMRGVLAKLQGPAGILRTRSLSMGTAALPAVLRLGVMSTLESALLSEPSAEALSSRLLWRRYLGRQYYMHNP